MSLVRRWGRGILHVIDIEFNLVLLIHSHNHIKTNAYMTAIPSLDLAEPLNLYLNIHGCDSKDGNS
jgi:hypothetical protein